MATAILPRDVRIAALARVFARRRKLLRSFLPNAIAEALRQRVMRRASK